MTLQKKSEPVQGNPSATRIKEITYRSADAKALNNALRMIKELRKRVSVRDEEKRIKDEIVVQEKLILGKGLSTALHLLTN